MNHFVAVPFLGVTAPPQEDDVIASFNAATAEPTFTSKAPGRQEAENEHRF
jgi:hypothetical protein